MKDFLKTVAFPLLVVLLTPSVTAVGSKIATGDWLTWFQSVPLVWWLIGGAGVLLWFVAALVLKRIKHLKELNAPLGPIIVREPPWGWVMIAEMPYLGVRWRVVVPAPLQGDRLVRGLIHPNELEVHAPPRCPECKTELEESSRFWGGYLWTCAKCGFKRRNKRSFYLEQERAERIARSDWEGEMGRRVRGQAKGGGGS